MFDKADLVTLPGLTTSLGDAASDKRKLRVDHAGSATLRNVVPEVNERSSSTPSESLGGFVLPNAVGDAPRQGQTCYVVEACAMGDENVALALSDGRLCHANLSRSSELASVEEGRWPDWRCWASRHQRVLQLTYSSAHDALVTLEVNLWAVSRPGLDTSGGGASGQRQASAGFEHALAVDLAELVGTGESRTGRERGAKHIAFFGNILAVATDHAVFLLALDFDVKGETPTRDCSSPIPNSSAPPMPTSRGDAQSPTIASPQRHTPHAVVRDKTKAPLHGAGNNSKSLQPQGFSHKGASTGGAPLSKNKKGVSVAGGFKQSWKAKAESGVGGVVEGIVSEAEDMVVCVLHPVEEGDGDVNGPAQPPPLLRGFDDDWEALRTRDEQSTGPRELEAGPVPSESSCLALPVTGNSAVLEHVGGCDVVLARRVGPGEVVRELHLMPVESGNESCAQGGVFSCSASGSNSFGKTISPAARSCRFVLLTSKGVTVCLVCVNPPASTKTPASPSSSRSSSAASLSSLPPPSATTASSRGEGGGMDDGYTGTGNAFLRGATPSGGSRRGYGRSGDVGGGSGDGSTEGMRRRVFLRHSCRFNHDLMRASIASSFLFALTLEGLEVWTFPSDKLPAVGQREGQWTEEGLAGGEGVALHPSPRPCLLHVQNLEIDGVLPRSPAKSLVSVGGARPGVLLFPSPPDVDILPGTSLAFLARQCRRRLRSEGVADEFTVEDASPPCTVPAPAPPPPLEPFFASPGRVAHSDSTQQDWQRKCAAWCQGFCGLGGPRGRGEGGGGCNSMAATSPLALFLRLRTPTEAFRLLAASEARARRPLPLTASAAFVSAAEGLHGALAAESVAAWRAAVCTTTGQDNVASRTERAWAPDRRAAGRGSVVGQAGIEVVLPELINCWRLQRVAMRCASLIGRLLLEEAASASAGVAGKAASGHKAAAAHAFSRACPWFLVSGETVAECFTRLQDVATPLIDAEAPAEPSSGSGGEGGWSEMEIQVRGSPSLISDKDRNQDQPHTSASSALFQLRLEESLPRAMYESYLLRALGVRDKLGVQATGVAAVLPLAPPASGDGPAASHDTILSGLVTYLHAQDMRGFSLPPAGLQQYTEAEARRSTPLSVAVICARRAPWATCPVALSQALVALDSQDKALAENTPSTRSSRSSSRSSNSSGSSSSALPSGETTTPPGASKRISAALKPRSGRRGGAAGGGRRRDATEHARGSVSFDDEDFDDGGVEPPPAQEWVAVARAVLLGYDEDSRGGRTADAAPPGTPAAAPTPPEASSVLAADHRILQLACERHPALVAPIGGGAGPLARVLLAGRRSRPLVAALVRLTSCGARGDDPAGAGGASFGPHRAQELLQLTGECFSPTVDPRQALLVFGVPGRQIATRLESLLRSSLDVSASDVSPSSGSPDQLDRLDAEMYQQSGGGVEGRADKSEPKALAAAVRQFLAQRCAASLARVDRGAREEERLAGSLGAPPAWQASLARNRALDGAILLYLIGAHLDDLRALEHSAAGKPEATHTSASAGHGWGSGLVGTARNARISNRRYAEDASWADVIVPLLTSQVSTGRRGAAEGQLDAILALVREVTWQTGDGTGSGDSSSGGGGMRPEEASEVVKEAKRRLPLPAPALALPVNFSDDGLEADDTVPWGSGGAGTKMQPALWPWGPRAVPPSAVGAMVALAAALPPSGKLLAGVDVMLQVAAEVIAAAKTEAAVAAGIAAAAAGTAAETGARRGHGCSEDTARLAGSSGVGLTAEVHSSIEEVSRAAERALLLYTSEYCGRDPELWASVTDHVRSMGDGEAGAGRVSGGDDNVVGQRLVGALLRTCGDKLGGRALVRALPDSMSLLECLDEVERSLLRQ